MGQGFLSGVEAGGIEPGGGDDAQPVGAGQRGQLGRGQQRRLRDVVQNDERGGRPGGVPLARGLGAAVQLGQHRAPQQGRVVPLGVGRPIAEFRRVRQLAEQRQQLGLALRAQHPQAGGVAVRPAVTVGHRQLGLALAPQAVDGGDEADGAGGQLFMQAAQFLAPADKPGVLAAQVARHALGAARALDALPEALAQHRHPLAHVLALERHGALGKPGADVGELPARDRGQPPGVVLLPAARRLDEIDRRDAVAAHKLVDLAAEVLVPFPAAILAAEIVGREADQKNLRVAQRAQDAVPPVLHVPDGLGIEENAQRLGGKAAVVLEDVVAQRGDPADAARRGARRNHVVLPRVAQEDFVGGVFVGHNCCRVAGEWGRQASRRSAVGRVPCRV